MKRNPNCTLCPLHKTAKTVCLLGEGPRDAEAMIIGEAPGQREDDKGVPFVGSSGLMLDEVLEEVGLDRDDLFVTNAVACRPPQNRTPKKKEIEACKKWLDYQMAMVKPKFVALLGNVALQSVLGIKGIKKYRGRIIEKNNVYYMPMYHPSFIMRGDGKDRPSFLNDFKEFKRAIQADGFPKDRRIRSIVVDTWKKVEEMIEALVGVVSFDIETTCLYPWADIAKVVTLGFGTSSGEYSLFHHHKDSRWTQDDIKHILELVAERLKDCIVVMHNGKFDSLWMKVHYGLEFTNDFDTMLAHYLIDENDRHGLDHLASLYFGAENWDIPLEEKQGGARIPRIATYHAHDLYFTRKLYFVLMRLLKEDKYIFRVFNRILMPAARLFRDMELHGCYIDQTKMDDAEKYLREEMAKAEKALKKWGDINWGSPLQVAHLLYDELGIKCPMKTKKGANSTSESALKQVDHPAVADLLKFRGHKQQLSFFIEGWKPYIVNHRIHPSFKLHGTTTGRPSCVRKGTPIMTPGGTKPIEEIRAGDLVYAYDDNLALVLKKVKWAAYTGMKRVRRIHWRGQGAKHTGYLDVTEDHRLRLVDGSYTNNVSTGTRLMALHRQSDRRNFLYATHQKRKLRENRVVFEAVNGWSPEHVHHRDENPLNDKPSNLIGMTHREHISLHASQPRNMTAKALSSVKHNAIKARKAFKEKTKNRFTKDQVITALEHGNGVLGAKEILNCSYDSLRRRIDEWGLVEWRNNHIITDIEQLPGRYPVYDLEVEEVHNFIAGEVCVHNCEHPNFQQVPRDPRIRTLVTAPPPNYVIVEADLSQIELRLVAHLSQVPAMVDAFNTGKDIHWKTALSELERYAGMADVVKETARVAKQLKKPPSYAEAMEILMEIGPDTAADIDPVWKELRKKAKAINFGFVYGMWWKKFRIYARDNYDLHITDEEAQNSRTAFFDTYPLEDWHRKQQRFSRENGFVRTLSGRKRRLPDATGRHDTPQRAEAWRQAINSPIQGFASDLNLMVLLQMAQEFPDRKIFQPIITVHDAILAEVHVNHVKRVVDRFEEIMRGPDLLKEFNIRLSVPLAGDTKVGPWGAGVSLSRWEQSRRKGVR